MINLLEYKIDEQFNKVFACVRNKEVVLFCAGNYKIWYDSFGPSFAQMARQNNINCFVYGGKEQPIVPDNLVEYMNFVEAKHPSATIVVIDNCLRETKLDSFDIEIKRVPALPGAFDCGRPFGNISILLKVFPFADHIKYLKFQEQVISVLIKKLQNHLSNLQKNATKVV